MTEEQSCVRDKVLEWVKNPDKKRKVLTLGGYAGTGKSTLIRHIQAYLEAIDIDYAVVAFTGKAVAVLRKKGVKRAQTCHSLIYTLDDEARSKGKLKFVKRGNIDERVIVVDEASMIPAEIDRDLRSFPNLRILYVGDHGQLEPVGEDPNLMRDPELKLETVHRQALGSNVIQFATATRMGNFPRYGRCFGVTIARKTEFYDMICDPKWDQIIVGFNRTRLYVNEQIRKKRGYFGKVPDPGERVICLNNNRDLGLFNGMILTVASAHRDGNGFIIMDLCDDIDGVVKTWRSVASIEEQFGQNKVELKGWVANAVINQGVMLFDYAYAITVHKSQGSEWGRVLICEEIWKDWDPVRWRYTAITRAIEEVAYCC